MDRADANYFALADSLVHSRFPLSSIGEHFWVRDGDHARLPEGEVVKAGGVRYLRAQDLKDGAIEDARAIYVTRQYYETLARSHVKPGYLLFSIMASIGNCAVVPPGYLDATANRAVGILVPRSEQQVMTSYVAFLFETDLGARLYERIKKGGLQQRTNLADVVRLQFPLPPVGKQRELVSAMESAREAHRAKLAEADALLSALDGYLLEALGLAAPQADHVQIFAVRQSDIGAARCDAQFHHPKYSMISASLGACPHPRIALSELSPQIVGGATPKRGDADLYADSGIRFLRILNVKPNEIDPSILKYIQAHVDEGELERSQLANDDILMTITGRVGTAAVVTEDILPANINQHLVRLRVNTERCRPLYLAAYLNSSVGLALSNRGVTGGTRIALDYEAIRNLQIPIPSVELQDTIATEIRRRGEHARVLRAEAEAGWIKAKQWFEGQLLGPAS